MNLITNLYRPVELYIILEKSEVQFIDLLALVLSELLSKNVLAIEYFDVNGRIEAGNLKTGKNFKFYQAKPIDEIFLHLFKQNSSSILNFQYVLLTAIDKASSKRKVLNLAARSSVLHQNLKNIILSSLFGIVILNKQGKTLSDQIKYELSTIEQRIKGLIKRSNPDHKEILNLLRNRFYFLHSYDVEDIFGAKTQELLVDYQTEDYDITYELSLEYLKKRLQRAHVEILRMDYRMEEYEIRKNGEGLG